jgi:hypothetical protein
MLFYHAFLPSSGDCGPVLPPPGPRADSQPTDLKASVHYSRPTDAVASRSPEYQYSSTEASCQLFYFWTAFFGPLEKKA